LTSLSTFTKEKEITNKIALKKIEDNSIFVMRELMFDYDKWNLKKASKLELDRVVTFLKENQLASIELSSHTDCRGTDDYNDKLSKRRTESCIAYLVSRGISKDRIQGKWFGESQPLNKCNDTSKCTEEEYLVNRRTEIKKI